MNDMQCTLAGDVAVSGIGLFWGQPVDVRFRPAEADTGIVFVRTDLPGRPRVEALVENVPPAQRFTALKKGDAEVRLVEHVLAALCGVGIDNVIIETSAAEMPVGDGSALFFCEPLLAAGLVEQDVPRRRLGIGAPTVLIEDDIVLMASPLADDLVMTYALDYGQRFVRSQALTVTFSRETFLRDLAPARTYVLRPEVDAFVKMGLGKGATEENTIVLEEDGRTSIPLRFPDEFARHKILDMLGDLMLAGGPISGRVLGYKSGHAVNVRLARAIFDRRATR